MKRLKTMNIRVPWLFFIVSLTSIWAPFVSVLAYQWINI